MDPQPLPPDDTDEPWTPTGVQVPLFGPTTDPLLVLAGVIRDQSAAFERMLQTVADLAKHAISPPASYPELGQMEAAGAPVLEQLTDSDVDPMEVFLGIDFLREDSGLYDASSDSPFGLPGIKDESPALVDGPVS